MVTMLPSQHLMLLIFGKDMKELFLVCLKRFVLFFCVFIWVMSYGYLWAQIGTLDARITDVEASLSQLTSISNEDAKDADS